ncbi:MAG TPA: EamA family transporter RarD [Opitutales bacterium]|nr:EamA family transporter RarD [Opitutales bacterium]
MTKSSAKGYAAAGGAFLLWGLVPLYWKQLADISALELMLHRIVWSVVLLIFLIKLRGRMRDFLNAFSTLGSLGINFLAGSLLSANWLIYIWAVNADRIIDTSLGYFLVPFVSTALGLFVLNERLNRAQIVAMVFALIGVMIQVIHVGRIPWVGLGLAGTFGLYGLLRKRSTLGSLTGLGVETTLIAPVALGMLIYLHQGGNGSLGQVDLLSHILIIGTAVVTTVPLLLFSVGARLIPLSRIGLMQFITPFCTLFLGLLIYDEPLPPARLISFIIIWIGLMIYLIDLHRDRRRNS